MSEHDLARYIGNGDGEGGHVARGDQGEIIIHLQLVQLCRLLDFEEDLIAIGRDDLDVEGVF